MDYSVQARVTPGLCLLSCSDESQQRPQFLAGRLATESPAPLCLLLYLVRLSDGALGLLVCVGPSEVTPAVSPRKDVLDGQRSCPSAGDTVSWVRGKASPPIGSPFPRTLALSPRSGKTVHLSPLSLTHLSLCFWGKGE